MCLRLRSLTLFPKLLFENVQDFRKLQWAEADLAGLSKSIIAAFVLVSEVSAGKSGVLKRVAKYVGLAAQELVSFLVEISGKFTFFV